MTDYASGAGRAFVDPFPPCHRIEEIPVAAFENVESLFQRMLHEMEQPGTRLMTYLNIHVANVAWREKKLKEFLQQAHCIYCDGMGICWGAGFSGGYLPARLPAADWFLDFFRTMARHGKSVFLLGGKPGVPERMLDVLNERLPEHTVVGTHHGYIHRNAMVERWALRQIHRSRPDILVVGFGTPLQEFWIEKRRDELKEVPLVLPLGAVMDYFTGEEVRCPRWMGNMGLEWLYRFGRQPGRMFGRYVIGNPWFFSRLLLGGAWIGQTRPIALSRTESGGGRTFQAK